MQVARGGRDRREGGGLSRDERRCSGRRGLSPEEGKSGSSGMFWRGPNDVRGGPNGVVGGANCPKKYILSMPLHRHNVKVLHRSEGAKS